MGYLGRLLARGSESGELVLHRVDSCEITSHVVVAASLVVGQSKSTCHIGAARCGAAEVDHGGQILFLPERDPAYPLRPHGTRDAPIQQSRGQLDGMARHDAAVEAVEPAGILVAPGALRDHLMVMDAVACGFLEGPVRNLVHADCARCRLIEFQGIPRQMPSPVGSCHRIPSTLDLSQRSQQLGRHDRRRMFAEERAVLFPCLGGVLVERAIQRKEDFGRLVVRMIGPVDAEPEEQDAR